MHSRGRRRFRRVGMGLVLASLLTGCAQVVDGSPGLRAVPNATLPVHGDSGGAFDTQVKNALSDVTAFWKTNYPSISAGKPLPPLSGGLYSVDGAEILRTAAAPATVDKEACIAKQADFVVDNAAYCVLDDSIVWDRNALHLLPVLAARYGAALVALVFAHEYGHAIQNRLGVNQQGLRTIYTESQADCAAGAFTGAALHGRAPHFHLTNEAVDKALSGFLQIRDSTPVSPDDISHGNGFDRLSAIQDGIEHGATFCYSAAYFQRTFTERGYLSDSDYQRGGNESLASMLDPNDPAKDPTAGGLQPDLNRFWGIAGRAMNKPFTAVKIAEADHPPCGGVSPASQFGYCSEDNTIYYSAAFASRAYYSLTVLGIDQPTGNITLRDNQAADFALGTLFAVGWGMAARHQFLNGSTGDQAGLLAAVCYAGAYADVINLDQQPDTAHPYLLSPPDMDEATSAMLTLVGSEQAYGARQTSGLQRIQSFVKGYKGGQTAC